MSRFGAVLLPLLLLLTVSAESAPPSPRLYVCNQGEATVSIIDVTSKSVEGTIDLTERGFSANAKPHHVVAEPDGSHWYVTLIGANAILKFNRSNELVDRLSAFEVPGLMALSPTTEKLYVGRSMSAVDPPKSVGVIDRGTMTLENEIDTFFPRPHPLTIHDDGRYAFVASLATNQLMGIDTDSEDTALTRLGGNTQTLVQFAAGPDGTTLLAGGQRTGQLLLFDTRSAPELSVTDTLSVGKQPWHPVISANGNTAYVPNKKSHSVSVVDLKAPAVKTTITGNGLAQPHGTALSPNGRYLFVSNNNRNGTYTPNGDTPKAGTVTVIDTQTHTIVKVIEVGTYPTGIGGPGGARMVSNGG